MVKYKHNFREGTEIGRNFVENRWFWTILSWNCWKIGSSSYKYRWSRDTRYARSSPWLTFVDRVATAYPVNSNLYHYASNNPVKYVDPDGRVILGIIGKFNMSENPLGKKNLKILIQQHLKMLDVMQRHLQMFFIHQNIMEYPYPIQQNLIHQKK